MRSYTYLAMGTNLCLLMVQSPLNIKGKIAPSPIATWSMYVKAYEYKVQLKFYALKVHG